MSLDNRFLKIKTRSVAVAVFVCLLVGLGYGVSGPVGRQRSENETEQTASDSGAETETKETAGGCSDTAAGPEIVDSYCQYANGYDYRDLYTMLAEITRTSPLLEGGTPVAFLFRMDTDGAAVEETGEEAGKEVGKEAGEETGEETGERVFLLIGIRREIPEYHLYTMDGGYVYELLTLYEEPMLIPSERAIYLSDACEKYVYSPHVLLKYAENLAGNAIPVPWLDLSENFFTADTIDSFIPELGGLR